MKNLADSLGKEESLGLVSQWGQGCRPIPVTHCTAIEAVNGGIVTHYELHPDIFGPEPADELKNAD